MSLTPDDARFLEEMRIFSSTGCIDEFDHRLRRLLRIVEGLREAPPPKDWLCSYCAGAMVPAFNQIKEERDALKSKLTDAEARIKAATKTINETLEHGFQPHPEGVYIVSKLNLALEYLCGLDEEMEAKR